MALKSLQDGPTRDEYPDAEETSLLAGHTKHSDPETYLALSNRLSRGQWKMFAFVALNYFMNGMANLQQVSLFHPLL